MPVQRGKDGKGPYYQWGDGGKRYHYITGDNDSRDKVKEQGRGRQGAHGYGN